MMERFVRGRHPKTFTSADIQSRVALTWDTIAYATEFSEEEDYESKKHDKSGGGRCDVCFVARERTRSTKIA
jgi:hypothetical protein